MNIDDAAHAVMDFVPEKTTEEGDYKAFYHEEGLYSVRNSESNTVMLVYARNPHEAIETVRGEVNYFGMTVDAERRVMENCIDLMAQAVDDVFLWDWSDGSRWKEYCEDNDIEWDGESNPSDYLLNIKSNEWLFQRLISRNTRRAGMTSAVEECKKIYGKKERWHMKYDELCDLIGTEAAEEVLEKAKEINTYKIEFFESGRPIRSVCVVGRTEDEAVEKARQTWKEFKACDAYNITEIKPLTV